MALELEPRSLPGRSIEGSKLLKSTKEGHFDTLGSLRYRSEETGGIILIPAPSADPNDPLKWRQTYKYYLTLLVCLAMFLSTFLAAGPTVAMVETAKDFFPDWKAISLSKAVSNTAYFFTTTALLQGLGSMIWMPLVNKYGRRPIYIASFALYFAFTAWASVSRRYNSFLASRILIGFASGAAETIAPLTIADIFFSHERGAIMAWYTASLSIGVAGGVVISGLITIKHNWRFIYYISIALIGGLLLLAIFSFRETNFVRRIDELTEQAPENREHQSREQQTEERKEVSPAALEQNRAEHIQHQHSYWHSLRLFSGIYTDESLLKLFIRPFLLIILPPVLWSSMTMAVTIGFLVAVTSNVSYAFRITYGFESYETGLCFVAAIIGSLFGIYCGGSLSEKVADFLTKRNGGIREPEMRLPTMLISCITTPLSLVLYGIGIHYKLHWLCPTIALALLNFSIVQATNISLVYTIDAYRPIAGEITLTSIGFKSAFGFLLSFYTNPWIVRVGYRDAYGSMAGIAAVVLLCWVPLYLWGKKVRLATWDWSIVKFAKWSKDREVGE